MHRQFSLLGVAVPGSYLESTLSTGTATRRGLSPQRHAASLEEAPPQGYEGRRDLAHVIGCVNSFG